MVNATVSVIEIFWCTWMEDTTGECRRNSKD